jgi:hypothetical protein
MEDEED